MTLRQLPGLASLGLLSALLAHEAAYGGSHAAGGAYHAALLLTVIAGSGVFGLLAVLAAVAGRRTADGSLLAAVLRPAAPRPLALLVASGAWFASIEAVEPKHTELSIAIVAAALLAASLLVWALAQRIIDVIAGAVIAILRERHRPRLPFVHYIGAPAPSARAVAFAYRRFARPPPV